MLTSSQTQLHNTAKRLAKDFHRIEGELLDVLQKIDREKIYLALGYSSLFKYSVSELDLSEPQAYAFMAVARKAQEVPILKAEIKKGDLTLSKAVRIVSVVNANNQEEWISKAKSLPKSEVEKAVAKINPVAAKREVVRRFDEESLRITLNLSEEAFAKLKRVQVLESTRQRKNVSLEEVISQMSELYIHHKDPVKKSERALSKDKSLKRESGRKTPPLKGRFSSARLNDDIASDQAPQFQKIPSSPSELCPGKVDGRRRLDLTNEKDLKPSENCKARSIQISRKPIPASIKHQVMQRDRGVCQFQSPTGQICGNPSFIEIHHKVPVSKNGQNTVENLTTFCSAHHSYEHHRI